MGESGIGARLDRYPMPIRGSVLMFSLLRIALVWIISGTMFLALSACGGGGGGASSSGSSSGTGSTPIALYAYGDVYGSSGDGNLVVNPVNTSGIVSLSATSLSTSVGPGHLQLAAISGNEYLYVADDNGGNNNIVSIFKVSGSTVTSVGSTSMGSNITGLAPMVYASGVLFVPLASGAISSYTVNSDGSLTLLKSAAYTVSGGAPWGMALDASGKYLVVSEEETSASWNALALTIGPSGTLSLSSEQTGISGVASNIVPDPVTTKGDYLYASTTGYVYEIALTSGTISVTVNSSIPLTSNTNPYPAWIDPTGTYIFFAEYNLNTFSESLVQYTIGSSGALMSGSMPSISIASGSNGSSGGFTNSIGFYESANGIVVIPVGGYLTTYTFNSLNGYLTALSLHTGDAPSGWMAAYAP